MNQSAYIACADQQPSKTHIFHRTDQFSLDRGPNIVLPFHTGKPIFQKWSMDLANTIFFFFLGGGHCVKACTDADRWPLKVDKCFAKICQHRE